MKSHPRNMHYQATHRRLIFEPLEERRMLFLTVTDGPGPTTYLKSSGALAVDPLIDISSTLSTIDSATATISANFTPTEDSLVFEPQSGITGSYNASTGVLSLGGTASVEAYQLALRSIAYADSNAFPSLTSRAVKFTVTQDGLTSNPTTQTIDFNPTLSQGLLPINGGTSPETVQITFITGTPNFTIDINGSVNTYTTNTIQHIVFTGGTGAVTLIYDDPSDPLTATLGLETGHVNSPKIYFGATAVTDLYIYGNAESSAQLNDPTGSNVMVGVASGTFASSYSYLAGEGAYSEASGFSDVTAASSASSNYAFLYSTSGAHPIGNLTQTLWLASDQAISINAFPQTYIVGAADGSDTITLDSDGDTFVATPTYSYVTNYNGSSETAFTAAIDAKTIQGVPAGTNDLAYFYTAAGTSFVGAASTSTLTGSNGSFSSSSTQAVGYRNVYAYASSVGTDGATLSSGGNGKFLGTSTYSWMTVGSSFVEVQGYKTVTLLGAHNGTDTAYLYDAAGANTLTAAGNQATLTTPVNTLVAEDVGYVLAIHQNGTSDTKNVSAIDFALGFLGSWT